MVTLKVRHIDEEEAQNEPVKSSRPKEVFVEEKTVSVTGDWKTFTLVITVIIIVALLVGFNMQDTGLQDNMTNIQKQETKIRKHNATIDSEQIGKAESEASIVQSKKTLLEKYKVTVN